MFLHSLLHLSLPNIHTHAQSCRGPPIDPLAEIRKIRRSINAIEQSIRFSQSQATPDVVQSHHDPPPGPQAMSNVGAVKILKTEIFEDGRGTAAKSESGPGAHGRQARGFYAGPTSASSHLISASPADFSVALSLMIRSDRLGGDRSITCDGIVLGRGRRYTQHAPRARLDRGHHRLSFHILSMDH